MERQQFAQGYGLLTLHYPPRADLEAEELDLLEESWWQQVRGWRGDIWLEACQWWIGHKEWMPKVAEIRDAYDALLEEVEAQESRKRPALPAPRRGYQSLDEYGRGKFARGVAQGALRQRLRIPGEPSIEPTEAEIDEELHAMYARCSSWVPDESILADALTATLVPAGM